jgi:hypothetical protein
VKLRCCNNAVIQMLFDILGAIKVKNIFGYELFLVTYLRISNQFDSMGFTLSQVYFLVLDAFYWGVFCKIVVVVVVVTITIITITITITITIIIIIICRLLWSTVGVEVFLT